MARKEGIRQSEILAVLDRAFEEFLLPEPANANYPMALGEITTFRSANEWLLVYQLVCYARKDHEFVVNLHAFGNRIAKLGLQSSTEVVRTADGNNCWAESDEGDIFSIDLHNYAVLVRGRLLEASPRHEEYEAAGIDTATVDAPTAFLRFVTHVMPDAFLSDPDDLLRQLGKSDLHLVLRLTEWQQPDMTEDELPSTTPCFQAIAASLAAGESTNTNFRPTTANSHWSQWFPFK